MRYGIIRKPFLMWDDDMKMQLIRLTLQTRGTSGMRKEMEEQPENLMTWVAIRNKQAIGWGLQVLDGSNPTPSMFYIHAEHRRMRVATKIAKRMVKDGYRNFFGWGWNLKAQRFFESLGVHVML